MGSNRRFPPGQPAGYAGSMADRRIDDLIRESRATRAAAEKACSEAIEIEVNARHLRGLAAIHRQQREELFCLPHRGRTEFQLRQPTDRADHPDRVRAGWKPSCR